MRVHRYLLGFMSRVLLIIKLYRLCTTEAEFFVSTQSRSTLYAYIVVKSYEVQGKQENPLVWCFHCFLGISGFQVEMHQFPEHDIKRWYCFLVKNAITYMWITYIIQDQFLPLYSKLERKSRHKTKVLNYALN